MEKKKLLLFHAVDWSRFFRMFFFMFCMFSCFLSLQSAEIGQQNKKVIGVVKDLNGEPIIGANVVVKGKNTGTITDVDGNFSIDTSVGSVLRISFIGYETQNVKVTGEKLTVELKEEANSLDEVVVVGYGLVKKSDLTGSVGTVKAQEIDKMPVTSIDQVLQGRISGVHVRSSTAEPGGSSNITIRGGNSISASNEPLYVIDGIIGGGNLDGINPSDVASIEVLKDASSIAIYGSRGANGVVLITTKRGDAGQGAKVTYNGYYGIQTPEKLLDLLSGPEMAQWQNESAAFRGDAVPPYEDTDVIGDTDWQDYIYRKTAPITNHNLNISNATKNTNYFLSLNYYNQEGLMYNSGFERYQIRFNIDQKMGNYMKLGATMTSSFTYKDNSIMKNMVKLPSTIPAYDEDGTWSKYNPLNSNYYNSPIALRECVTDNTRSLRALGNVFLELTPIKNLLIKSSWGFDLSYSKHNSYQSSELPLNIKQGKYGVADVETNFPITYQNENTVNYLMNIGKHSIGILGGFTWQKYMTESLEAGATGFTNDANLYHSLEASDPSKRNINSGESEWGMMSYLFRLNYSYKSRYLFTVTGRGDGSSRLTKGNQWAFFPSAAFAWRASEEKFIKDLKIFSNLKLRASYGVSGSQAIGAYAIWDKLTSKTLVIGDSKAVGYVPGLAADKNLGWEKTSQVDFGLEAGFLDNRITLEADYYYKRTDDLLLNQELPYQTGFDSILRNIGSVRNQGLELTLNTVNIATDDFRWSTNFLVSFNRNKVMDLGDKEFLENGIGSRITVGEPLGLFYGLKYLGPWKEEEIPEELKGKYQAGDVRFDDVDGNNVIDELDRQVIGNAEPKFYGGIGSDFTWKDLTVSLFFDYSYGNDIYDLNGSNLDTGYGSNLYGSHRNRWTEDNQNAWLPRAGSIHKNYYAMCVQENNTAGGCSLFVHDGSYLRLKNVNVQYNIPFKNKKILKSLQVYATVSNVFTWTPYFGYSPDVDIESSATRRGFDKNTYPQSRTYLLGLKVNF